MKVTEKKGSIWKLMLQRTYKKLRVGLTFLFIDVEVEIYEIFKTDTKPFMEGIKKMIGDDKLKVEDEKVKSEMLFKIY